MSLIKQCIQCTQVLHNISCSITHNKGHDWLDLQEQNDKYYLCPYTQNNIQDARKKNYNSGEME